MPIKLPVIQREHISYSEWNLFHSVCEHRWYVDYCLEYRSKTDGIELSFGTAMHYTLERLKSKKPDERPTLQKAKSIFIRSLIREHMRIKKTVKKEYVIRDYVNAGLKILENIDRCGELRDGTVIWNEFQLNEPIDRSDGEKLNFKGYIDIAIKVEPKKGKTLLYICDFKTCSWGWPIDKKQDLTVMAQLVLYKHFVCKKFSLDPKNVRTAFILLKKRPKTPADTVEFYTFSTGPKTMEKVLEMFQSDITKMRSGLYQKNRKSCTNKYGESCPYLNTNLCTEVDGAETLVKASKEPLPNEGPASHDIVSE